MAFELHIREIPLFGRSGFHLPIHPRLLSPDATLDPRIAHTVFPRAVDDWHGELETYLQRETDLDSELREFYEREFLNPGKPHVTRKRDVQSLNTIPFWEDRVYTDGRGFATTLMIHRNSGGSIYYNSTDSSCRESIRLDGTSRRFLRLPPEKIAELCSDTHGDKWGELYRYSHHNVDYAPGALFLRSWGIHYLNEAMKSISINLTIICESQLLP